MRIDKKNILKIFEGINNGSINASRIDLDEKTYIKFADTNFLKKNNIKFSLTFQKTGWLYIYSPKSNVQRIYLFCIYKYLKQKLKKVPEIELVKELNDYEMQQLQEFKKWIYEKEEKSQILF